MYVYICLGFLDGSVVSLGKLQELVMDWRAAVHGVAKSQTWLIDWTKLNWKNPPAKQEMLVQSLVWEEPLEKETATHANILFFFFFF